MDCPHPEPVKQRGVFPGAILAAPIRAAAFFKMSRSILAKDSSRFTSANSLYPRQGTLTLANLTKIPRLGNPYPSL
jgi:hypothetical protein